MLDAIMGAALTAGRTAISRAPFRGRAKTCGIADMTLAAYRHIHDTRRRFLCMPALAYSRHEGAMMAARMMGIADARFVSRTAIFL